MPADDVPERGVHRRDGMNGRAAPAIPARRIVHVMPARLRIEREDAGEIRDWLRVLKDFLIRRNQRERIDLVVIDTMDVLASMAHLEDPRNELFHFFHFLRSMGVTAYVLVNADPSGTGVSHDVAFLADGVFELRFSGAGEGKVQLLFRCAKMRHTNHSRDYFVLTYDKGFTARPYETPNASVWRRRASPTAWWSSSEVTSCWASR